MKRKQNPQGFHKRGGGRAGNPSQLQAIRETLQSGNYSGALTTINDALATASGAGSKSLLLSLAGDCLFRQGKFAEAAELYGETLATVQTEPTYWLRPALGEIQSLLKGAQVEAAQAKAAAALEIANGFHSQYQALLTQAQSVVTAGGQVAIPAEPPPPAKVASRLGKIFFSEGEVTTAKSLFQ